jgi:AraC-like DNA-binding protein
MAGRGGPAEDEDSPDNSIALLRRGVFRKHVGRRCVTADLNHAIYFSEGSNYRVSHPADCGDCGTVLRPSRALLQEIKRALDPAAADRAEGPFPFITGPCEPGPFRRHRELLRVLEGTGSGSPEPLRVDETALLLVADLLAAAYSRLGLPPRRMRTGTDADRAERVEAAKAYLSTHLGERVMLDAVAQAVHTSAFHLARIFREQTGVPVHRYLTRLRLRASVERLVVGAGDLTALALELGFSSHAHFSDSFRREFGRPPSQVRRERNLRALQEASKNLEV